MVSCRAASGTLLCCAQAKVLAPRILSIMNRFFLIMVLVLVIVFCRSLFFGLKSKVSSFKFQVNFGAAKVLKIKRQKRVLGKNVFCEECLLAGNGRGWTPPKSPSRGGLADTTGVKPNDVYREKATRTSHVARHTS